MTEYAGQAVCVILADSHANAIKASKLVKISYSGERKPINDARDIIKNGPKDRIRQTYAISPISSKCKWMLIFRFNIRTSGSRRNQ